MHPGRFSKKRWLVDDEVEEAVGLEYSEDSVQYVNTLSASEFYYWRGYDHGVVKARLACQYCCCAASHNRKANPELGN